MNVTYYTLNEVAERLKVTRRTIYNWIKAGKLEALKAGREYRVTEEAITEFTTGGKKRAK